MWCVRTLVVCVCVRRHEGWCGACTVAGHGVVVCVCVWCGCACSHVVCVGPAVCGRVCKGGVVGVAQGAGVVFTVCLLQHG